MVGGEAVPPGGLGQGLPVEVPPEEQPPVPLRQGGGKAVHQGTQLLGLELAFHVLPGGALGQLLQEQRGLAPAALAGVFGPPPVDGQVPGQPGQKKAQPPGALGRDAVPGSQPGVADALLGVPGVPQDVVGQLP